MRKERNVGVGGRDNQDKDIRKTETNGDVGKRKQTEAVWKMIERVR